MKLFLKLFFVGIPFGLIAGITVGLLKHDLLFGITSGLTQGLFFALSISLIIGTFHKIMTRNMSADRGGHIEPRQSLTETVVGPYDTVFEKCIHTLQQRKAKIIYSDKKNGSIVAKLPASWKSFGEELKVYLEKEDGADKEAKVTISSSPRVKTTIVDYGKGLQNVTTLLTAIKS